MKRINLHLSALLALCSTSFALAACEKSDPHLALAVFMSMCAENSGKPDAAVAAIKNMHFNRLTSEKSDIFLQGKQGTVLATGDKTDNSQYR
ncbi:MAG: hypothetical protein WBJ03_06720 [Moraxellaceae bacterium]